MSAKTEDLNFSTMCRACMTNGSESHTLTSLASSLEDDVSIASVIDELTAVQIQEHDGLPELICASCVEELKRFVEFIKMVRQTDRLLRQIFKSNIIEVKVEDEDSAPNSRHKLEMLQVEAVVEEEYLENDLNWTEDRVDDELETSPDNCSEQEFIGFDDIEEQAESPLGQNEVERSVKIDLNEDVSEELDEVEQKTFKILARNEGDFLCCFCFQIFSTEEKLIIHCERHKTSVNLTKSNVCQVCFRRYKTPHGLELHRRHSGATKIFECVRCLTRFVDAKRRRQHAHNHPRKEVLQSSVFTPIVLLPDYRKGRICCAQACGLSFPTDELLIAHAHEAHRMNKYEASLPEKRKKPLECLICFKRFDNRNALRLHQVRKYKKSPQQCSICGCGVRGGAALAAHERNHRNEKPFQCELCPKRFTSAALLKAHSIVHSNDRQFVCSVCGMAFQRKVNLQNHELIHLGQLPYPCELCKKSFRVKYRLEQHKRSHTGVRPYPCRYCDKSFADHSNRQRHEMSHTGIKPYKCSNCEKTFITKRLRSEHEATHRCRKG
ncbi:zinc finger protein 25-like [Topomyia yanbarensis]|uniref:zinc finger protein 25-like n=1 Tax=Topomyia yanbarensis TaxID=2498891 RepID=UPI00273A7D8C|nr:zinc finger protein 25-like [Topomyia yanbarensis]